MEIMDNKKEINLENSNSNSNQFEEYNIFDNQAITSLRKNVLLNCLEQNFNNQNEIKNAIQLIVFTIENFVKINYRKIKNEMMKSQDINTIQNINFISELSNILDGSKKKCLSRIDEENPNSIINETNESLESNLQNDIVINSETQKSHQVPESMNSLVYLNKSGKFENQNEIKIPQENFFKKNLNSNSINEDISEIYIQNKLHSKIIDNKNNNNNNKQITSRINQENKLEDLKTNINIEKQRLIKQNILKERLTIKKAKSEERKYITSLLSEMEKKRKKIDSIYTEIKNDQSENKNCNGNKSDVAEIKTPCGNNKKYDKTGKKIDSNSYQNNQMDKVKIQTCEPKKIKASKFLIEILKYDKEEKEKMHERNIYPKQVLDRIKTYSTFIQEVYKPTIRKENKIEKLKKTIVEEKLNNLINELSISKQLQVSKKSQKKKLNPERKMSEIKREFKQKDKSLEIYQIENQKVRPKKKLSNFSEIENVTDVSKELGKIEVKSLNSRMYWQSISKPNKIQKERWDQELMNKKFNYIERESRVLQKIAKLEGIAQKEEKLLKIKGNKYNTEEEKSITDKYIEAIKGKIAILNSFNLEK